MTKQFYLDYLDAVRATIDELPQDARICRIYDSYDWDSGKNTINIQIMEPTDMLADRITEEDNGMLWAEKTINGVTVGWCVHEEEDDETAI